MEKLNIVAAPAAQVTDFLDVELNLATGEFKPYRKPNDSPVYINANSNHIHSNAAPLLKRSPGYVKSPVFGVFLE